MDHQRNKESTRTLMGQFARFNVVGVINTLLAYLVYAGLVFIGVHHSLAVIADYAAGLCIGFVLNRRFTFGAQKQKTMPMFGRLILVYIPVAAANVILLQIMVDKMGLNKYLSQLALLTLLACVAFVLQKLFVFGDKGYSANG